MPNYKEKPDVWIEPELSIVVQVKAAEFVQSQQFVRICSFIDVVILMTRVNQIFLWIHASVSPPRQGAHGQGLPLKEMTTIHVSHHAIDMGAMHDNGRFGVHAHCIRREVPH